MTLIGKVTDAGPKLTYSDNGQPECRWTLAIEESGGQGKVFTTYVPCSTWGKAAETIVEQLDAGALVCIRDGRLKCRKPLVKGGTSPRYWNAEQERGRQLVEQLRTPTGKYHDTIWELARLLQSAASLKRRLI